MNNKEKIDLDKYITGNYGEDQFEFSDKNICDNCGYDWEDIEIELCESKIHCTNCCDCED